MKTAVCFSVKRSALSTQTTSQARRMIAAAFAAMTAKLGLAQRIASYILLKCHRGKRNIMKISLSKNDRYKIILTEVYNIFSFVSALESPSF